LDELELQNSSSTILRSIKSLKKISILNNFYGCDVSEINGLININIQNVGFIKFKKIEKLKIENTKNKIIFFENGGLTEEGKKAYKLEKFEDEDNVFKLSKK
jgi:hypothetical protein